VLYFGQTDDRQACILADGRIQSGEYSGSIHQVGREIRKAPCNGWLAWYYIEEKTGIREPIDLLRKIAGTRRLSGMRRNLSAMNVKKQIDHHQGLDLPGCDCDRLFDQHLMNSICIPVTVAEHTPRRITLSKPNTRSFVIVLIDGLRYDTSFADVIPFLNS
jgi:hypothetical protein